MPLLSAWAHWPARGESAAPWGHRAGTFKAHGVLMVKIIMHILTDVKKSPLHIHSFSHSEYEFVSKRNNFKR